jgi:ferric-dicitrate binding protein FerR (iron transport regulator)
MNAPATNRFDELVSRYLDGELNEGERVELLQLLTAPEMAERFLELTKLNAEISGLLSAPVPDNVMVQLVMGDLRKRATNVEEPLRLRLQPSEPARSTASIEFVPAAPSRERRPRFQFGALKWAAVLVALIAVAVIFYSDFWRSSDSVKVTRIEGEVYLVSDDGQKRLQPNAMLEVGKVKTVGAASRVTLALADGTTIDVSGDSTLATRSAKDRVRFFLENGSLKSRIIKPGRNHPLIFATPEAEAIVKGTAPSLTAWAHHTRLVVTEGQVLLKRQADGAEVMVNAGFHVLVGPKTKLNADPNDPAPRHP